MIELKIKKRLDSVIAEIEELENKMSDHKKISTIDYCKANWKVKKLIKERDELNITLVRTCII